MVKKYITEKSEDYSLVDKHTGELLDYCYTKKVSIDEFIMVFFTCVPQVMKLNGTQLKVLMCCWKHSSFNPMGETEGNVVNNNASFKNYVRRNGLDISDAAIDNAISALHKKNFLLKKCRGEYILNPSYFFKGTLSQRSHIRLSVEYDPKTNSSKTFFIYSSPREK